MKIIIIVGLAVILIGGAVFVVERLSPSPLAEQIFTDNQQIADVFSDEVGHKLSWRSGAVNASRSRLGAGGQVVKPLYLGAAARTVIEVRLTNPAAEVSLTMPSGAPLGLAPQMAQEAQTGETVLTYEVRDNKLSGTWQVTVTNPAGAGESEVAVSTPEATPPLAVTASTESVTTSGETITIVLVVEETTVGEDGDLTVKAVSGAEGVAIVTDPNGNTTTVILTESPTDPGTYEGEYTGGSTPGVYTIEYVITGTKQEGQ